MISKCLLKHFSTEPFLIKDYHQKKPHGLGLNGSGVERVYNKEELPGKTGH